MGRMGGWIYESLVSVKTKEHDKGEMLSSIATSMSHNNMNKAELSQSPDARL